MRFLRRSGRLRTLLEHEVPDVGLGAYAHQVAFDPGSAPTTSEALPANGGSIAIPIVVPVPMLLDELFIHNRDAASLREAEWRLYRDVGSAVAVAVKGADGTFSFTPTVASDRASVPSGSPVMLPAGLYWLVLRNTSSAQTFGLGYANAGSTYWNQKSLHRTKTLGSALGDTLDFATGWTGGARLYGVRLGGQVTGDTF